MDTAIVGAGPYGLSLAAHLNRSDQRLRIFGAPMRFWSQHMPQGMCLKSEGFASNLYDPDSELTLRAYCAQHGIAYADIGHPVRLETFIAYGMEFQRRFVPQLEAVQITRVAPCAEGFELTTAAGEIVHARRAVMATGLMRFAHVPPELAGLPYELVTHSSQHSDLSGFSGRHVAVIGAGASAIDIAALLHQAGAQVELIARRRAIEFQSQPQERRSLLQRLRAPRSGLGIGWRSRLCTDAPMVFHAMPESLRIRAVQRHLGPAPCWFVREQVVGRFPMHLGARLISAAAEGQRVRLGLSQGPIDTQLEVDHVIAATGYRVELSRLDFLDATIQSRIAQVAGTPIVDRRFESSIPGLYVIGAAAANSFGPLLRFAYGARFAAKRVASRLTRT